ncbi:hypothetical protein C8R44DRAFT_756954 [Mycena epipterygia]|nr:hypothetical protein C8R44DRAFT_756954 [Mycena epipterygia]
MQISSPRAPRSSHHRSSSTRTSPRTSPRHDRVRPFGGHRPNQPNYDNPPQPALVPENLNDNGDVFNVDPAAATLEAGGETYQEPVEPAGRRRFVGGFVGGLRKAMQRNRGPVDEGVAYPEPAVVHEEERQYESVPAGEPEIYAADAQYASSMSSPRYASPDVQYAPDPRYASPNVQYALATRYASSDAPAPDTRYATTSPDTQYRRSEERQPHHRQESSYSTSETAHVTYEGTTVVNHDMVIGSPELHEPEPGSDYAKMDSPPRSEASFGSYLTRVHRFFQTVNNLPWVAPDRVTVDYIPGRARQAHGLPTARPRPARRPVISWYNPNAPQNSIDLLSSVSSPLTEFPQTQPMPMPVPITAPTTRYPENGHANNVSAAEPPPMAAATRGLASVRPHRVPVPPLSPDLEPGYAEPRYPNGGYVPYDRLDPAHMPRMFTGSSMASALPPPGTHQPQASGPL